jgi:hypothetical protein
MTSENPDNLGQLLAKQLSDAEAEAMRNGGAIPESALSDVARLAQFVEIRDKLKSPPRRQRWPVAVVFALTLLLASILFFTRVHETGIDLQVVLSEVELGFSADRPWTDAMQLSSLGVSGLNDVIGPPGVDALPRRSLKLIVAASQRPGQLTLAPIFLPAKSRVWLRTSEIPGSCRMSIQAQDVQFRADVLGQIDIAGIRAVQTFRSPQGFLLNSGSREAELEFVFLKKEQNPFVQHLPLQTISMFSVEQFSDADRMLARKVSSVISGVLYFESLAGRERKLRQGETLEIEPANGVLERIVVTDGKIVLEFHGIVNGIKTGDDGRTDLMPTCLEWLQARHGLSLMWGTSIYLLGLVMGVLRWAGARV